MYRILILSLLLVWAPLRAEIDSYRFDDPTQEARYQQLINELRCLVCQNQTIADSNADLAKDLRRQVYEMLQQGQSSQQITDFMTQRYGDFVRYRPAMNGKTLLLWLGPGLLIALALLMIWRLLSDRKASEAHLSQERQQQLQRLLDDEESL